MGRRSLDTRQRANNAIKKFAIELNAKLNADPEFAKEYTLNKMCEDFSKFLTRKHIYSSSSMLDILKRNGLTWLRKEKKIVPTTALTNFQSDDFIISSRIHQTFISVDKHDKKMELKNWLETNVEISDDILAVISVSKGLLVLSDKPYVKTKLLKMFEN